MNTLRRNAAVLQILGIAFFRNLPQGRFHALLKRPAFHRLEFENERVVFVWVTRLKYHVVAPAAAFPIARENVPVFERHQKPQHKTVVETLGLRRPDVEETEHPTRN